MLVLPIARVNPLLWRRPRHWHVLSVCREPDLPIRSLCASHCHLNCDDLFDHDFRPGGPGADLLAQGAIPPNAGHVETALRFARAVGLERLIVHCRLGQSRSPASAWCLLYAECGSEAEAWARLHHLCPHPQPNARILRLGRELLRSRP